MTGSHYQGGAMTNRSRVSGTACIVGGALLLAIIPIDGFGTSSPLSGLIIWGLAMACLMGGPLGLLALRAAGGKWLGTVGAGLALLGQATQIVGMAYIFANPALESSQLFTPLGAQAIWLGMLLLGVATLRARKLTGWRRFTPLIVSAYFVVQIAAVQIPFYLTQGFEPNFVVLALWGLPWILLGLAVRSSAAATSPARSGSAATSAGGRIADTR